MTAAYRVELACPRCDRVGHKEIKNSQDLDRIHTMRTLSGTLVVDALVAADGRTYNRVLDALHVSGTTGIRYRADGLTDDQADMLAGRLGLLPCEVWPDWYGVDGRLLDACDMPVVDGHVNTVDLARLLHRENPAVAVVERVTPGEWKRHHRLIGKDKDAARALALDRWPGRGDLFTRKKDHGRADAALIAAWHLERRAL